VRFDEHVVRVEEKERRISCLGIRTTIEDVELSHSSAKKPKQIVEIPEYEAHMVRMFLKRHHFKNATSRKAAGLRCCVPDLLDYPLHVAVRENDYLITRGLLAHGANKMLRNHEDQTPIQLAMEGSPIMKLLHDGDLQFVISGRGQNR